MFCPKPVVGSDNEFVLGTDARTKQSGYASEYCYSLLMEEEYKDHRAG